MIDTCVGIDISLIVWASIHRYRGINTPMTSVRQILLQLCMICVVISVEQDYFFISIKLLRMVMTRWSHISHSTLLHRCKQTSTCLLHRSGNVSAKWITFMLGYKVNISFLSIFALLDSVHQRTPKGKTQASKNKQQQKKKKISRHSSRTSPQEGWVAWQSWTEAASSLCAELHAEL